MTERATAIPTDPKLAWNQQDADWFVNRSRHNLMLLREPHDGELDISAASYELPTNESYWVVVRFIAGGKGAIAAKTVVALAGTPPLSQSDEQIVDLLRKHAHRTPAGAVFA